MCRGEEWEQALGNRDAQRYCSFTFTANNEGKEIGWKDTAWKALLNAL